MHDFLKQMIRLRKTHSYAFEPAVYGGAAPFAWKTEANVNKTVWTDRHLMMHFYDSTQGPQLAVLINMERGAVTYTLPTGLNWGRILDTQT